MSMQRAVIILSVRHAAAGRADNSQFRHEFGLLFAQLPERCNHHAGCPMQTLVLSSVWVAVEPCVRDLSRGLGSTTSSVEPRYRQNAVLVGFKSGQGLFQAESQRANHPGGNHGDTRFLSFSV